MEGNMDQGGIGKELIKQKLLNGSTIKFSWGICYFLNIMIYYYRWIDRG